MLYAHRCERSIFKREISKTFFVKLQKCCTLKIKDKNYFSGGEKNIHSLHLFLKKSSQTNIGSKGSQVFKVLKNHLKAYVFMRLRNGIFFHMIIIS